jgi:hypothetical protein
MNKKHLVTLKGKLQKGDPKALERLAANLISRLVVVRFPFDISKGIDVPNVSDLRLLIRCRSNFTVFPPAYRTSANSPKRSYQQAESSRPTQSASRVPAFGSNQAGNSEDCSQVNELSTGKAVPLRKRTRSGPPRYSHAT